MPTEPVEAADESAEWPRTAERWENSRSLREKVRREPISRSVCVILKLFLNYIASLNFYSSSPIENVDMVRVARDKWYAVRQQTIINKLQAISYLWSLSVDISRPEKLHMWGK